MRTKTWLDANPSDRSSPDIVQRYPPAISRRQPTWLATAHYYGIFPDDLRDLMDEVYAALHNDMPRLAASGIRTIVDMVMTEKVGDEGGFATKLKRLVASGLIAEQQSKFVESVVEAGHASVHRGYRPSMTDLNALMDIVEGVVATIYIQPTQSASVKMKTPKREK